jgi:hypothetical protein
MTSQQMFEDLVKLAAKNGWPMNMSPERFVIRLNEHGSNSRKWVIFGILFDHSFARAIFGDNLVDSWDVAYQPIRAEYAKGYNEEDLRYSLPMWQYHLQQMAIARPNRRLEYAHRIAFPDSI